MWQETKHGLYKQFNFADFREAFAFMTKVAALAEEQNHHPRWENDWSVVQIWLMTHEGKELITDKDRCLAAAIDAILGQSPKNDTANPERTDDTKVARARVKRLKIYTDGGSRGNPGPSASGYVLYDENGNVLVDNGIYLGITTNNQAEYTALKLALEEAKKLGASEITVFMDSLLVVNQMNGIFKIKNRDLWPLHDAIKQLAKDFKKLSFSHVPREQNKVADAAVNRALDEQLGLLK
ncbi:MAG: reverse transcriptase-like protein [Candidatus Saccharimonadales bacterium]